MSIVSPSLLLWSWCFLFSFLIVLVRPSETSASEQVYCQSWQFRCSDGTNCLSPNRFCDGNEDCGDASDEPPACTNCNRTLMGETGEKYPLRITEPGQRQTPFYCTLNLVAAEGQLVESSFLSFQIGYFGTPSFSQRGSQDANNSVPVCRNGFMHVSESGTLGSGHDRFRSQQTRGFSQLISAVKEEDSRKRLSTLFDDATASSRTESEQNFGYFCGRLMPSSTGVSFYSTRSNVTISIYLPPRTPVGTSQSFGLYFTYRFLQQQAVGATSFHDSSDARDNAPRHYGKLVPKTYCNRTFSDCERKECLIRSPNYPGLFLRNFSCSFFVRQERVESGKIAFIEVSQDNEYKIRVGKSSAGRQNDRGISVASTTGSVLTSDCDHDDRVEIYDFKKNETGGTRTWYLLTVFCGSGILNPIVSRGRELLVVLRSGSEGLLYASRLELRVRVILFNVSDLHANLQLDDDGKCSLTINATTSRSGLIRSPRHTLPRGTVCTVNFIGNRPKERIWIYFLSYLVQYPIVEHDGVKDSDAPPLDKCDVSMLELDISANRPNTSKELTTFRFCERTTPRVCARAIGYVGGIPEKVCLPPHDSYLSSGTEATVKYSYFGSPEVGDSVSSFEAHYEFVNFEEIYSKINDTFAYRNVPSNMLCGKRFQNHIRLRESNGNISSPANVFLYGRGGRQSLECRYQFQVRANEKLRISVEQFWSKIDDCETVYNAQSGLWNCRFNSDSRRVFVVIRESSRFLPPLNVGCICSNNFSQDNKKQSLSEDHRFVYDSVSTFRGFRPEVSDVTLEVIFSIKGMTAFEDHSHFGFSASFHYQMTNKTKNDGKGCQAKVLQSSDSSTQASLAVHGASIPKCRWALSFHSLISQPVLRLRGIRCGSHVPLGTTGRVVLYGQERDNVDDKNKIWMPNVVLCLKNVSRDSRVKSSEWLEFMGNHWLRPSDPMSSRQSSSSFLGSTHVHQNQSLANTSQNLYTFVLELLSWSQSSSEVTFEWRQTKTSAEKRDDEDRVADRQSVEQQDPVTGNLDCTFRCPELNACINPELWCDGIAHCPTTGFDELPENCARYPFVIYAAIATGISLVLGSVVAIVTFFVVRRATILREEPQEPDIFVCDPEPDLRHQSDKMRKTTERSRNPKYHTRQIRAVEVRHPVIHM